MSCFKKYTKSYWLFMFGLVLYACGSISMNDLEGLWQLSEVEIDGVQRKVHPILLEMSTDHSFAVSRISGDLIGMYRLQSGRFSKQLRMRSEDSKWFNTTWSLDHFGEYIDLKGVEEGYRNIKLRFVRIDKVPAFDEFENRITGRWQLYKIRKKRKTERLSDTWFTIDEGGNYSIVNPEGIQETGKALINTRHRKIIFEKDDTAWSAWFYGEELRLDNEKIGIQYSLRKRDELE